MKSDPPRFWKSAPFLISTFLILLSYVGFWLLSDPKMLSSTLDAAGQEEQSAPGKPEAPSAEPSSSSETDPALFESDSEPSALLEPAPVVKTHLLEKGDTLSVVLSRLGVSDREIYEMMTVAKKIYNLRKIHPGQTIAVTFDESEQQVAHFSYEIDRVNSLEIAQREGQFTAAQKTLLLERDVERRAGVITDTLYDSARRFGVPSEVILDLSDIFAWDIDFGNDIRVDDQFKLVYEVFKKDDEVVQNGRVLAAEMTIRGEVYRAYYFAPEEGERGDYYDAEGRSLRKAFMKSPLRYRYISSGYAKQRLHPVLKVNRPHLGIDFAAKHGTPVRAAGDGVVTFAGNNGGYGKTIIIKHKNGYKTLYGHLSSFEERIRKGAKVKQEEVIARVGSTGMSTGPHLHYTLYKNEKAINPRDVEVLRGESLSERWMSVFSGVVTLMDQYLYPASDLRASANSL